PAFREAFAHRRCVVPANGLFDWKALQEGKAGGSKGGKPRKQPYFIHAQSGGLVLFAGLWERWKAPEAEGNAPAEPLRSCAIITTAANPMVAQLHDRMPAVLSPDAARLWMDP